MEQSDNNKPKEEKPSRRRARQSDGTFKGNNPETPLNEAWEPIEAEVGLEKDVKYTIKPKVSSTSEGEETAGKYKQQPRIRPTFGTVYTKTY